MYSQPTVAVTANCSVKTLKKSMWEVLVNVQKNLH